MREALQTPARFVAQHTGAAVAVVAGVFVPLKLLRVAHGDSSSALAILAASDKTEILSGVIVLVVPFVATVLLVGVATVAGGAVGDLLRAGRGEASTPEGFAVLRRLLAAAACLPIALWLGFVLLTPGGLAVALALAAVAAVVDVLLHGRSRMDADPALPGWLTRTPLRLALLIAALVSGVVACLISVVLAGPLDDRVWLPPMSLAADRGEPPRTVYVLSRSGDRAEILDEKTRAVEAVRVRSSALDSCRLGGRQSGASAWDRLVGRELRPLAPCPD
jgi:hypothetical protein